MPATFAAAQPSLNPYATSYLSLEIARNDPVSFSQNRFKSGFYGLVAGYRHNIDADWLASVSASFKSFKRKPDPQAKSDQLALLTLSHTIFHAVRLNHPTYLLFGPQLLYLLPTRGAEFPVPREDAYDTEIGVGLSFLLAHILDDQNLLTLRLDRWRGTKTMLFHGLEIAVGISVALDR